MSKRSEYMRIWRVQRYIRGLCTDCNSPIYMSGTKCKKHLLRNAKYTKAWKAKHDSRTRSSSQEN